MLYLVSLLIISSLSFAKPLRIHSVGSTFVKFTNGEVGFWQSSQDKSFKRFRPLEGQVVDVTLGPSNEIFAMNPALDTKKSPDDTLSFANQPKAPTILSSYKEAQKLLNTFDKNYLKEAECYDRAHVWSYESETKHNVVLEKIFLFFADHYIEKFKFKWWFHVAPMAHLTMKDEVTVRVMDKRFSKYPLKTELWTNIFMRNKSQCKEIELYTEYSEHPFEDDCYIIKSSAYFWQPRDLEEYARSRYEKTDYVDWEIKHAYLHAFGKTL